MASTILHGDCNALLDAAAFARHALGEVDLTFLDPPFNQNKDYDEHKDDLPQGEYWEWMREVCGQVYALTSAGGALYFMHREKNAEFVLRTLRESGWTFQNLIAWKKTTSAVPGTYRFGKSYQVIGFATKGTRPRVFNRLRINPPLAANYKYERPNGMYVTDIWDDIRELTSGYFAGDEALRDEEGNRLHKQQAPIELLLRIILSSTKPGDLVLDPFAGTGTTLVVAGQVGRRALGIEQSERNVAAISARLQELRRADEVSRFLNDYSCTTNFATISGRGGADEPDSRCRITEPAAPQLAMFGAASGE